MEAQFGGEYLGHTWVGNSEDAHRFVAKVASDRSSGRYEWWKVVVGSMSPSSRAAVIHEFSAPGLSVRKFHRRDSQARRDRQLHLHRPTTWKERVGFVFSLAFSLPAMIVSTLAKLVGRGPRMYLLHAPVGPPGNNPPGGAHVREPRQPKPGGGSDSALAVDRQR